MNKTKTPMRLVVNNLNISRHIHLIYHDRTDRNVN